jgi:polyisoprenoid-binding protein YceI
MLKKTLAALALGSSLLVAAQAMAADYVIDKEGQHAFVNFKISHVGCTAHSRISTAASALMPRTRKPARLPLR